jgi:SpoVK/Ycf46/Vps4 family AAA+-type ATPase
MVKANLVIDLISKYLQDDRQGANEIVLKIIAEEETNKHYKSANQLTSLLDNAQLFRDETEAWEEELHLIPTDRDRNLELFEVVKSQKTLNDIIQSPDTIKNIGLLLKEWTSRARLAEFRLNPIKNVLFFGPPGCGKTLCAHVIAGELKLPLIIVHTDALISSLLGETSVNLRKIYNSIGENRSAILFFDEFDAIAKSRTDNNEHGEIRRTVTSILQMLENSSKNVLTIMATNHPQILDNATWRRFDLLIEFPKPDKEQVQQLIDLKLQHFSHEEINVEEIFPVTENLNHADIERACIQAIKEAVLNNQSTILKSGFEEKLREQVSRKILIENLV